MKMLLNDRTVTDKKPVLPEGATEATFTDDKIKGFYLRVRPTSRTFIFQYQRDGVTRKNGGFSGWSAAKAQLDAKLPRTMPSWTLHHLRHAVVTGMAESERDVMSLVKAKKVAA